MKKAQFVLWNKRSLFLQQKEIERIADIKPCDVIVEVLFDENNAYRVNEIRWYELSEGKFVEKFDSQNCKKESEKFVLKYLLDLLQKFGIKSVEINSEDDFENTVFLRNELKHIGIEVL